MWYSCHLFSISSASVGSIPFLSFIKPIFARNVPLVPLIFLKRSPVFPILLFSSICIIHLKMLPYLYLLFFGSQHSVKYIFPFLLFLSLIFISQLSVRSPQTTVLPCICFLGVMWSQCYKLMSIVLQALCLPDLIP